MLNYNNTFYKTKAYIIYANKATPRGRRLYLLTQDFGLISFFVTTDHPANRNIFYETLFEISFDLKRQPQSYDKYRLIDIDLEGELVLTKGMHSLFTTYMREAILRYCEQDVTSNKQIFIIYSNFLAQIAQFKIDYPLKQRDPYLKRQGFFAMISLIYNIELDIFAVSGLLDGFNPLQDQENFNEQARYVFLGGKLELLQFHHRPLSEEIFKGTELNIIKYRLFKEPQELNLVHRFIKIFRKKSYSRNVAVHVESMLYYYAKLAFYQHD